MTTIAFLDCSAGVAGDMLLGALIDAGAPLAEIERGLRSMRAIDGEWGLRTSRVWKGPGRIAGTKVHVDSAFKHREAPAPGNTAGGGISHDHIHSHGHHEHNHDHSHEHSHDHSHEHGHHEHVDDQEALATSGEHHDHSHDHSGGSDAPDGAHEPMRNLDDIKQLVLSSDLSDWVKTQSIAVFSLLAEAEAHTHGTAVDEIHFHEVGAIDSIVDTVGSVLALDLLGVRRVYSSFLPFSSGTVKCMHGLLPVPPPATFRLMIDVPVCPAPRGAKGELVTPTGISLVKALATAFGEPPAFVPSRTGVGAGTKEFPFHANIVRVAIGTLLDPLDAANAHANPRLMPSSQSLSPANSVAAPHSVELPVAAAGSSEPNSSCQEEEVVVLETNLDDLNPQVVGFVFERLLESGGPALDVWTQPIQMKKSRPGVCLSVLCLPHQEASVLNVLFHETTTLGVRKKTLQRVFLRREFLTLRAFERAVAVKVAFYGDKVVNVYPEYEDCKAIARDCALPLLDVIHSVQSLAKTFLESHT